MSGGLFSIFVVSKKVSWADAVVKHQCHRQAVAKEIYNLLFLLNIFGIRAAHDDTTSARSFSLFYKYEKNR